MNLNIANGWGIVRTIVDMVLKMDDGKYVLVKDPNKNVLRLYAVPAETFEEDETVVPEPTEEADGEAEEE
jgi:translation initiation factor 3 subunit D